MWKGQRKAQGLLGGGFQVLDVDLLSWVQKEDSYWLPRTASEPGFLGSKRGLQGASKDYKCPSFLDFRKRTASGFQQLPGVGPWFLGFRRRTASGFQGLEVAWLT